MQRRWWMGQVVALVGLLALLTTTSTRAEKVEEIEARMRRDITFLASPECEGRGVQTEGLNKAAAFIAEQFQKAGLKPGGSNNTWFQPFTMGGAAQEGPATITLKGPQGQTITLEKGKDFNVLGFSGSGKVNAPLVFAGHGITATDPVYDDYRGLDVAGKIVVVIRKTPRYEHPTVPFDAKTPQKHATFEAKLVNAELHKAAAMILVNDVTEEAKKNDPLVTFKDLAALPTPGSIPALHLRRNLIDSILRSSLGQGLGELEAAIDRDLTPRGALLKGWSANLDVQVTRKQLTVKNVVGVLEGSGPLAKETVVIGGHYDHLGYGESGSLAKTPMDRKKIHFGADDNASGTTTVIELARRFGAMKNRQGRRLVFITFSAEEKGLLGSRHYCTRDPRFPLESTVAMVNLDMVGRLSKNAKSGKEKLLVEGAGTAKHFDQLLKELNKKYDFEMSGDLKSISANSDHTSFYRAKVPVVFFWTGIHSDYHRPSDTADRINVAGMRKIADISADVINHLVSEPKRPELLAVAIKGMSTSGGGGAKLGVLPDYNDKKGGLLLEDVAVGGAAAKAGLKGGDRIVEIAGQPVTNIGTYMAIMGKQKRGQAIPVAVERGDKKLMFQVTPQ